MAVFRIIRENDIELKRNSFGKKELVLATGIDYIRIKLKARLLFHLGEFFADIRQGFPYRERILVSNPDLDLIRAIFWEAITTTPGIIKIQKLELLFDRKKRTIGVDFTAITDNGELLSVDSRVDTDFILQLDNIIKQ
jgi:hypothetical protein